MKPISDNIPFIAVLTAVWLIILALCALIGVLVVPVQLPYESQILEFVVDTGKVVVSMFFVLIWLLGWYQAMGYLLQFELFLSNDQLAKDS